MWVGGKASLCYSSLNSGLCHVYLLEMEFNADGLKTVWGMGEHVTSCFGPGSGMWARSP